MSRRVVVLAALVLAALVLGCTAPAWVRATTSSPSVAQVPLAVSGSSLAPGVAAGALVVAAAALALALGRRWGQRVALLGLAAGGALVTAASLAARGAADAAALGAASQAVGVASLLGEPRLQWWPWCAAGLGLAVVALALLGALRSRSWARPSQRFEAAATAVPTGSSAAPSASAAQPGRPERPGRPEQAEPDDVEVWEALSRGEDPT